MSSLPDYQRDFANSLMATNELESGTPQQVAPMAIYRNNYFSNLSAALADVYPVVRRLVGAQFFDQMARRFITGSKSTSGNIQEYGADFGDFIGAYLPARELVYLPDVARLEWLCHQAFHAADCAQSAYPKALDMPYQHYGRLCFEFHPACRFIESSYPIGTIWHANQPESAADQRIELANAAEYLLIRRPIFTVAVVQLSCAQFVAFKALSEGQNLEAAINAASFVDALFDIEQFLAVVLAPGVASGCWVQQ